MTQQATAILGDIERQVDIYSTQRGTLIERMAVLAGKTTWRDPGAPFTPRILQSVPWEHVLEASIVWLHEQDRGDVTPDILHGVAIMHMPATAEDRCTKALADALADMSAMCARMTPGLRDACTRTVLRQCVTGRRLRYPPRATAAHVGLFDAFGARIVWAQAEQGLRRASAALK